MNALKCALLIGGAVVVAIVLDYIVVIALAMIAMALYG